MVERGQGCTVDFGHEDRVGATRVTRRHGGDAKASHMLLMVWRELGRVLVPMRTVLVVGGQRWRSKKGYWGTPGPKQGTGSMLKLRTLAGGETRFCEDDGGAARSAEHAPRTQPVAVKEKRGNSPPEFEEEFPDLANLIGARE